MALKFTTGGQFENPPPGSYIARCYAFIDLGSQPHAGYQGKDGWISRDCRIVFELPLALMTGKYHAESKGKPFSISLTVKQSLAPTAKLRKFLKGWRGRDFTPDEIAAYVPKNIVGAPCRLTLVENGDFVNIEGIAKLMPGEVCPPAVNPTVYFSLDKDEFDVEVLKKLGDKTQEKIAASPEYNELVNPRPPEPTEAEMANQGPDGGGAGDSDVPFASVREFAQ